MLGISPINASQKNRQSAPTFKGEFSVGGKFAKEAYEEFIDIHKIADFTKKCQSRLVDHGPFPDYFVVTCENKKDKTIFEKLHELAEKFDLKFSFKNNDPYKTNPDFDLEKAHLY